MIVTTKNAYKLECYINKEIDSFGTCGIVLVTRISLDIFSSITNEGILNIVNKINDSNIPLACNDSR